MATTKRSVTLDVDLVEEARRYAGERGLSRLLNEGLRRELRARRLQELARRYAEEDGFTDEELAAARGDLGLA